MKVKKIILSLFVIILVLILGIGSNVSLATSEKSLYLSYGRWVYDGGSDLVEKGAFQVSGDNNHCIYQIRDKDNINANGLYCLNAKQTSSWSYENTPDADITQEVIYNKSSDFNNIDEVKNLTGNYKDIANSKYYGQVLWILDHCYVSAQDNDSQRVALLAEAGIKKTKVYELYDSNNYVAKDVYKYVTPEYEAFVNYVENESNNIKYKNLNNEYLYHASACDVVEKSYNITYPEWMNGNDNNFGHVYYIDIKDESNNIVSMDVELPSEIIESVQQAALWYFTNYKLYGQEGYNLYTRENWNDWLKYSVYTDNNRSYDIMANYVYENNKLVNKLDADDISKTVGDKYQEQASILYNYLIDGANGANPGDNNAYVEKSSKTPLAITATTKMKQSGSNYIVGPIKITKDGELPYDLNESLVVKDQDNNEITGAYLSSADGNALTVSDYNSLVGQEIYVTVPSNGVSGVTISFTGTYQTTNKTLLTVENSSGDKLSGEQLMVETSEENKDFELNVTSSTKKEFDLALRKAITKLASLDGTIKVIVNEDGSIATRNIQYVATDIANNNTATYNHRKDPVVVSKDDVVTYSITVYNEGDKNGYATEIVDQLPTGLSLKGYTKDGTTTGTYTKGDISYTYVYEPTINKITFTNVSKNVLNSYDGSTTLDSETIEVECEVTQTTSNSNYTYLTNIAYISEEYNSEDSITITNQDGADRDSKPATYPTSTLNTTSITKDSYNGYKGSKDNSVYNGNNGQFYYAGQEDDDDFEIIVLMPEQFDLKLVKYINDVNEEDSGRKITVDSSKLKAGQVTTADYDVSKIPVKVKTGDYVKYTLRIYNEAQIDGYAEEITEDIPNGLQFVYDNNITIGTDGKVDYTNCTETLTENDKLAIEFNLENCWKIGNTDTTSGKILTVTSDYLSQVKSTANIIKAYDLVNDDGKGSGLSYKEVSIMLKVIATDSKIGVIRNEAEISEDSGEDRDSDTEQWKKENDDDYYDNEDYPKYKEDDEDYDNIILEEFDLALRKFIAAVSSDVNIEDGEYLTDDGTTNSEYARAPVVNTTYLKDRTADTAIYGHSKETVTVAREDYVLYTIRVYNEGDIDGYASKITDHLPTYLDYVECEFNDNFGWKVDSDAKTISTKYLSSEDSKENILKAFDSVKDDGKGSGLFYKDVQILCKVNKNAIPLQNVTNIADITEYQDEDGKVVPDDRDSKSDNLTDDTLNQDDRPNYNGGDDKDKSDNYIPGQEDDDDFERIIVREFDLALLKYVSEIHVTENGNETVTQTGNTGNNVTDTIPKVEIYRKSLNTTVVKFVYTIKITNEGDIPGYATEITDYVPEGLKFYEEDNNSWTDEGNNVISTRELKGTLLNPGESATVSVTLRWINGNDNLGIKTNVAEISEDYNEYNVPDRDSTPDNKINGEDDIDDAQVLLSISTGIGDNIGTYIIVGGILLVVLASGIFMIKKFVL